MYTHTTYHKKHALSTVRAINIGYPITIDKPFLPCYYIKVINNYIERRNKWQLQN
jgi:hypothetical protein